MFKKYCFNTLTFYNEILNESLFEFNLSYRSTYLNLKYYVDVTNSCNFFYSYIMCTCLYLLAGTQEGKVSKFYIVPYRSVKKKQILNTSCMFPSGVAVLFKNHFMKRIGFKKNKTKQPKYWNQSF